MTSWTVPEQWLRQKLLLLLVLLGDLDNPFSLGQAGSVENVPVDSLAQAVDRLKRIVGHGSAGDPLNPLHQPASSSP
jgi:hypothetical protein